MVFSSHIFLFYFLPGALLSYYLAPRKFRNSLLTLISYLFYGWSNPLFCFLMFFSTLVDYLCGRILGSSGPEKKNRRLIVLWVSIVSNLGLLGVFKYMNFAIESFNASFQALGFDGTAIDLSLRILLPIGISFYTFQSMSYTLDVYRGDAESISHFPDFACYVSMFPQLVAGPIIRFQEVADQLQGRSHTLEKFSRGTAFFCLGLGKKVLLANPCGQIADLTFSATHLTVIDAWYGVIAYAFQIYFDFSGYSDMAIGLGLLFGFIYAKNFDSPYQSLSITEFWRRWHISLSTWLKEYLYIPLGGNRLGKIRTLINIGIVMFLGGLWHGASWNFIIWGMLHGFYLAVERLNITRRFYTHVPKVIRCLFTFFLVLIAWVFFRAESLPEALAYLSSMFGLAHVPESSFLLQGMLYTNYSLLAMLCAAGVVWFAPQTWDFTKKLAFGRIAWVGTIYIFAVVLLTVQSYNPFIYFNF